MEKKLSNMRVIDFLLSTNDIEWTKEVVESLKNCHKESDIILSSEERLNVLLKRNTFIREDLLNRILKKLLDDTK